MKVGILGTGDVGQSLGRGFLSLGHEVMLAGREQNSPKAAEWVKKMGGKASQGSFGQAAAFGEWVVLATLGTASESAIRLAGTQNFRGKIVLDATNPLDSAKMPMVLWGPGESAGEKNQRLIPDARLVKAFNTTGNGLFFRPKFSEGIADMFICGNDAAAKETVGALCKEFGWNPVDVGGIELAHYLEAMCTVWVVSAMKLNNFKIAYKLVGR